MSFESDTLKSAFTAGCCPVSSCELPYSPLALCNCWMTLRPAK